LVLSSLLLLLMAPPLLLLLALSLLALLLSTPALLWEMKRMLLFFACVDIVHVSSSALSAAYILTFKARKKPHSFSVKVSTKSNFLAQNFVNIWLPWAAQQRRTSRANFQNDSQLFTYEAMRLTPAIYDSCWNNKNVPACPVLGKCLEKAFCLQLLLHSPPIIVNAVSFRREGRGVVEKQKHHSSRELDSQRASKRVTPTEPPAVAAFAVAAAIAVAAAAAVATEEEASFEMTGPSTHPSLPEVFAQHDPTVTAAGGAVAAVEEHLLSKHTN
jgi:hypothetical protein